jgi:hypothetical protein
VTHNAVYWERPHDEQVVLDIGADVGAMVLYTPPAYRGREIEVSPAGEDARRVHTAVLERRVAGRTLFAAVYPELRAGDWRIWGGDADLPSRVSIVGGVVAEVDWR